MQQNKFDVLGKAADRVLETVGELASTQTSRTGFSAARVASVVANGVSPNVLAQQLTEKSRRNNPDKPVAFTAQDVSAIVKFHAANRTRSALPKRQARALISAENIIPSSGLAGC